MTAAVKTIEDLPHFRVLAVIESDARKNDFEFSGTFDRTGGVVEGRCSLLLPGKDILIGLNGSLKFVDAALGTASFDTSDESMPPVVGLDLVYLNANWEPYHVWMVAEPRWRWNRALFQAGDANAKSVEGNGVSIVEGEEVRSWIEIRQVGKERGLARFYPVFPSGRTTLPPVGPDGVVKGGWDHVHCELCSSHVNAGQYGYVDLAEHWVCESCRDKYVARRDLSFIQ